MKISVIDLTPEKIDLIKKEFYLRSAEADELDIKEKKFCSFFFGVRLEKLNEKLKNVDTKSSEYQDIIKNEFMELSDMRWNEEKFTPRWYQISLYESYLFFCFLTDDEEVFREQREELFAWYESHFDN
jgi:hypothetical protein